MTYRGQVKNGVIVLDDGSPLKEGTLVRVEPIDAAREQVAPPRGSPQAILNNPARWQGDPEEMDRLLAELKEMKRAEVQAQLDEWQRTGGRSPLDDE